MYVIHTTPPEYAPTRKIKFLAQEREGKSYHTWTSSWTAARTFDTQYHARNIIADINNEYPDIALYISKSRVMSRIIIEELVEL